MRLSWKRREGSCRTAKSILAILLALQMLALLALAACPALHHALHSESNNPDHDCLVTLFAKGKLNESAIPSFFSLGAVFVMCAVLLPGFLPQLPFEYRFAPSRAPPCF